MEIVLDTRIRLNKIQITLIKHEPPTKQMALKMNRTSFNAEIEPYITTRNLKREHM